MPNGNGRRSTDVVYGEWIKDELVFIPRDHAFELARLHYTLKTSKTWGEFKRKAPPEQCRDAIEKRSEDTLTFDQFCDQQTPRRRGGKLGIDQLNELWKSFLELSPSERVPFDADALEPGLISGYEDGDWPELPAQSMLDWVPKDIRKNYGRTESSFHGGDFLRFDSNLEQQLIDAFGHHGYCCQKDTALIRLASGNASTGLLRKYVAIRFSQKRLSTAEVEYLLAGIGEELGEELSTQNRATAYRPTSLAVVNTNIGELYICRDCLRIKGQWAYSNRPDSFFAQRCACEIDAEPGVETCAAEVTFGGSRFKRLIEFCPCCAMMANGGREPLDWICGECREYAALLETSEPVGHTLRYLLDRHNQDGLSALLRKIETVSRRLVAENLQLLGDTDSTTVSLKQYLTALSMVPALHEKNFLRFCDLFD